MRVGWMQSSETPKTSTNMPQASTLPEEEINVDARAVEENVDADDLAADEGGAHVKADEMSPDMPTEQRLQSPEWRPYWGRSQRGSVQDVADIPTEQR